MAWHSKNRAASLSSWVPSLIQFAYPFNRKAAQENQLSDCSWLLFTCMAGRPYCKGPHRPHINVVRDQDRLPCKARKTRLSTVCTFTPSYNCLINVAASPSALQQKVFAPSQLLMFTWFPPGGARTCGWGAFCHVTQRGLQPEQSFGRGTSSSRAPEKRYKAAAGHLPHAKQEQKPG